MKYTWFIAQRLAIGQQKSFTRFILRLAFVGVTLSVYIMILALGVMNGFQGEIREKLIGFEGHLQIHKIQIMPGREYVPIHLEEELETRLAQNSFSNKLWPYIEKTAILKANDLLEGIQVKGVDGRYDLAFLAKHLESGRLPKFDSSSNEILLARGSMDKLQLSIGDRPLLYFIKDEDVRVRRPTIVGVFNTGLSVRDELYGFVPMSFLQPLLDPKGVLVSGYEMKLTDFKELEAATYEVNGQLPTDLQAHNIQELNPLMFGWLATTETNVVVIITLMIIVAIMNIITAILVLIIDRTRMVGVLKAVGSPESSIAQIFRWQILILVFAGVLIGTGLAYLSAYLQNTFAWVKLDPATYFMDSVHFELVSWQTLSLAVGVFVVCYLALSLPLRLVFRISPAKTLRFE